MELNDKRGFEYFAGWHGVPLGWCQHHDALFLPWHRAYLYNWEMAMRDQVAGMTDGVAHVEIDAESRLDLVRRLDIRRTPTVLVLGPDGRITKRASGQPRKADVIAALGDAVQLVLPTDQIGKQDSDSEPGRA